MSYDNETGPLLSSGSNEDIPTKECRSRSPFKLALLLTLAFVVGRYTSLNTSASSSASLVDVFASASIGKPLKDYGNLPSQSLGLCEGDCDTNGDCDPGLVCFERDYFAPVPGCDGEGEEHYDYCVLPSLTGHGDTPDHTLGLCEGDCDTNADCDYSLVCFERDDFAPVPGCNGEGEEHFDYCVLPSLMDHGDKAVQSLGLCQGDCDSDADCDPGLVCFQRDDYTPVPGCNGEGVENYDYCVLSSSAAIGEPLLMGYGDSPGFSLGLCQGDCDSDTDCAHGLVCFQRDGVAPVPGCTGVGVEDYDYCVLG